MMNNSINSLEQLDIVCKKCILQTNYNQKTMAEQMAKNYMKSILSQNQGIESLISGHCSDDVLFVTMDYLTKQINNMNQQQLQLILHHTIECINTWFQPNLGQIIRNGKVLQFHTKNYIYKFIGESIKHLIRTVESKDANFFNRFIFNNYLQLIFWKQLANSISCIDTTHGFLSFRSIIYFYQDYGIVIAIDIVNKYFKPLTQTIRMNQLAILHQNLSVEQIKPQENMKRILTFTPQQLKIANSVIELIQEILSFPYNISYGQYDMDLIYQNCIIYFPDAVSKQILSGDFYESLFFLTERFLIELPSDNILMICIDSLKKIILTRVTYQQKNQQKKFTKQSLIGITRLMRITKNINNIAIQMIQFNAKMLGNIHLRKLRKYPQFSQWFSLVQIHLKNCLMQKPFKFHDPDFNDCFNLIQKLATGYKHFKLSQTKYIFDSMIQNLFQQMMIKLFNQTQPLTKQMTIHRIKQIKTACNQFFGSVKLLLLWNYQKCINLLYKIQINIFERIKNGQIVNVNNLINLNMLISQITHTSMVQQAYPYSQFPQTSIQTYKKIIQNQINYIIQHYKSIGLIYNNDLLNMTTLIYLEVVLIELCSSTTTNDSLLDNQYQLISISKIFKSMDLPFENTQQFLVEFIGFLMNHLRSEDYKQITHTLDVLNSCIMKLKWSIKRSYFKKMTLIKIIMKFCLQTSLSNFITKQLLKCRCEIMRLITLLAFDDCLDSFKDRLDQVFDRLDMSNILTLIYDIRGMAQQIDTSSIFRYFLQKSTPIVINILDSTCMNHLNNDQIFKGSIKLCQKICQNYIQRISTSGKTSINIYEFVIGCLPYWNKMIIFLQNKISDNPEKYASPVTHIIQCFNRIIDGHYINFSILQYYSHMLNNYIGTYIRFINELFKSEIYQYPKSKKALTITCRYIFQILNDYIFSIEGDQNILMQYCRLYSFSLQMLYEHLNQFISGKHKLLQFNTIIDFMTDVLDFQYNTLLQTHNTHYYNQAKIFKQTMCGKMHQIFITLLRISTLPSLKDINLDKVVKYLGSIIKIYSQNAQQIVQNVSICFPRSDIKQFMRFCQCCVSNDKQSQFQSMNKWRESLQSFQKQLKQKI